MKDSCEMDKKLAFLVEQGYTEGQLNWFGRNPHRVNEFCKKHGMIIKEEKQ